MKKTKLLSSLIIPISVISCSTPFLIGCKSKDPQPEPGPGPSPEPTPAPTEYLTWELDGTTNEMSITGINRKNIPTIVTIPEELPDETPAMYPVTKILEGAFRVCLMIREVTFPNTLLSIGDAAFINNDFLEKVNFSNSIESIGSEAFLNCHELKNFILPSSLKSISTSAFEHCTSLTNIVFPNNLEEIDTLAFGECYNLEKITLPQKVNTIESHSFIWCSSLKEIDLTDWGTTSCPTNWQTDVFMGSNSTGTIWLREGCETTQKWIEILTNTGLTIGDDAWVIKYKP